MFRLSLQSWLCQCIWPLFSEWKEVGLNPTVWLVIHIIMMWIWVCLSECFLVINLAAWQWRMAVKTLVILWVGGNWQLGRKSTTAVKLTELFLALDVKVLKIFSSKISDAKNSLLVCYIADFREKKRKNTKSVRY